MDLEPKIEVHPRIQEEHPTIKPENVRAAFKNTRKKIRRWYNDEPPEWVGVGIDDKLRELQYVADEIGPDEWFIFHCMPSTPDVLIELELMPRPRGYKTRKRKRNR